MASDEDPVPPVKPKALIFTSYGWKDAGEVAKTLARDLKAAGYDVWIDREQIREQLRPEDMFPEVVRKAIHAADLLLILITPHSAPLPCDAGHPDHDAA